MSRVHIGQPLGFSINQPIEEGNELPLVDITFKVSRLTCSQKYPSGLMSADASTFTAA